MPFYRVDFTYMSSDYAMVEASSEEEAAYIAGQEIWEDEVEILDVTKVDG